jgi:hypothetical protein
LSWPAKSNGRIEFLFYRDGQRADRAKTPLLKHPDHFDSVLKPTLLSPMHHGNGSGNRALIPHQKISLPMSKEDLLVRLLCKNVRKGIGID